jgi:LmbE family N-acetylglucosaminyl deacetylase
MMETSMQNQSSAPKGTGIQEERELVPYAAQGVIPASRVLVVAPHPDDEVFGCGGCARLHALAGAQVDVVVLTDGGGAGDPAVRMLESRAACSLLGLELPSFWAYPDRGLAESDEVMQRLVGRLTQTMLAGSHELVYAPSPWEVHPDHRATARAVAEAVLAVRQAGLSVQWAAFEVGAPLWPHRLVNLDAVWGDKRAAMALYPSQLAFQPYDEHIEALNRYRSYTVSGVCRYAEALWLPGDAELQGVIADWDEGHPHPGLMRGR